MLEGPITRVHVSAQHSRLCWVEKKGDWNTAEMVI